MLSTEVKRHIDNARQILVGVVPNPTSQIDQITNALIYKFMDDMDQEAIKISGKADFFIGDLEKYSWAQIMTKGHQEKMNLYVEGFIKISEAKNIPQLFRNILKSAYLPYRSPETLGLFLKEINHFNYSHPEELGNAYEYLLSIMSSQGDAGQFRTPRHIIDFMVDVIDPKKDEAILDPACGTAGFLISSYKHILKFHEDKKNKELSPDDKKKLAANFEGYDIDPTMVRISQVNMYLHQFKAPKIFQYDALSSEERWGDHFDVILANPPFMSPKGGIKPHSKFTVPSNRSEVLFVDYIMNHLKPKGRAAIIVPEGVIFQSGSSYKDLRKNLVNDGLYAVASLPSGVFNPYSGVKTSILFFDKELSKKESEILFIKIENDGFHLGAQRRPIDKNDLPKAAEILQEFKKGKKIENKIVAYVEKSEIAKNGDYNLSAARYVEAVDYSNAKWPIIKLGEVCNFIGGYAFKSEELKTEKGQKDLPVVKIGNIDKKGAINIDNVHYFEYNSSLEKYLIRINDVLVAMTGATVGKVACSQFDNLLLNQRVGLIRAQKNNILPSFLKHLLVSEKFYEYCQLEAGGGAQGNISPDQIKKYIIPLPPLEIQEQIVAELNNYQNIITGARQIVANWKPKIDVDPSWKIAELGKICDVRDGTHESPKFHEKGYPLITSKNIKNGKLDFSSINYISKDDFDLISKRSYVDMEDIIMPMIGTIGGACLIENKERDFAIKNVALFKKSKNIIPKYLLSLLNSELILNKLINNSKGVTQKFISLGELRALEIQIPPLETQTKIVAQIESERQSVESAKKLMEIYEQKTKATIAKLWSE